MSLAFSANYSAKNHPSSTTSSDSVNILVEMSLFWEYQKNKDYESAEGHGWKVIENLKTEFLKYKPFKKMEEVIWHLRENKAQTNEEKQEYTEKCLRLYEKALNYDEVDKGYFLVRKAYVLETWNNSSVEEVVEAYETAFETDPEIDPFYKDRLGILYSQNATDENGWKLKALDLYSALTEKEPENSVWISRIDGLAENLDELVEIRKIAWDLDKTNLEKAYVYSETCIKAQMFEKALEPLEFLVEKNPDVINYWRKLANAYQKLERNDDAIKAYKTLINLEPNNRENYLNLAIIYQRLGQLSVSRSYLQKAGDATSEPWDLPIFYEAQLYEQAARNCGFEFIDKCVYQLAVDTYKKAASLNGPQSGAARDRIAALANSVPQPEDYFFRNIKSGTSIKIEGNCYGWINRSIIVP